MQSVIGCTRETILDYIPNHDKIESSIADGLLKRYIQQFRVRTKNKIETGKDVYEFIKKAYRNIFDFAGINRRRHKGERISFLVFDDDIIKQYDDLIEFPTKK